MRRKYVYVSLSMLNFYETCFVKNEENKWRLCLEVFLMNEVRRGVWGLIGGEHRVHGTFLLESQPLDEFLLCFWSIKSSSILFMSCLFWKSWPIYGEAMSNFFQECAKNYRPLLDLFHRLKLSLMMK